MNKFLVIGAKGLVGGALRKLRPQDLHWDREDLDVTNFPNIHAKFGELNGKISAVINCVAFNDVDGAETNEEKAYLLNRDVPKQLALLSNACRVPLVHISTGYVFDGLADSYNEDSVPNPLSIYGKSKLAGENQVIEQGGRFYVVRTNVVFGPKGESELSKKSFVDIVLGLAEKGDKCSFVDDEINSITYAPDLAKSIIHILENNLPYGIYHVINEGQASWLEFAEEILKLTGNTGLKVKPSKASDFKRSAKRPARVVLENNKLPKLRHWKVALAEYLDLI